jgi:hypothetical protein
MEAPLKRRETSTTLHGAGPQKTAIFILAAVRRENLLNFTWFSQFLQVNAQTETSF